MDWFWIIVIFVVALYYLGLFAHGKQCADAKSAYRKSLAQLEKDPTNSTLRQNTLRLGRAYSNLARDNKGVTIFDEVALMNDINAACAGATNVVQHAQSMSPQSSLSADQRTLEERLSKLNSLREQGHISDSEYSTMRLKLLEEV